MNAWKIEFDDTADEDLLRLSPVVRKRIIEKLVWCRENFDSLTPLPLTAQWSGCFKFRVGDWRVVYDINWPERLITILIIDHRTKIYKRKRI